MCYIQLLNLKYLLFVPICAFYISVVTTSFSVV
jgi:hypothetical protein